MKKLIAGILCAALICPPAPVCAAEIFVNDGVIELAGEISDAVRDDILTVNVVSGDFDWDSESVWEDENYVQNSEKLKYYDIVKTDANGRYSIKFKLDDMGRYTVYLGSEYFETPVTEEFYYTNRSANAAAVAAINDAASAADVAEILKDNRYALMLYSDRYTEVDLDKVGELVYEYLSNNSNELDAEGVKNLIYKGFMVYFLDSRDIDDFAEYSDCLGMDSSAVGEYWSDDYGRTAAEKMEAREIGSVEEYDENMFYTAAGCVISKNDGTDGIKAVLKEHMERTDSNTSVTDAMCSAIAGKSLYTKSELDTWISSYLSGLTNNGGVSNRPGGGGSGGGSGGSSGGGYKTDQYNAASGSAFNVGLEMQDAPDISAMESIFVDLDNAEWAEEAILGLYSKGIVSGRTARTFEPHDTVLREEFVKMLMLTFNLNIVGADMSFLDVDENGWYYKYISCAYHSGIVKGFSEEEFGIGQNITRQDLCVMVNNTLELCEISTDETYEAIVFTDEAEIADYAKTAVERLQRMGIIQGSEDGSFNPTDSATRAEAAKIMYMISGYIV